MSAQLKVGELVYKISGDMSNLQTELKKAEAEISNLKAAMKDSGDVAQKANDKTTASVFKGVAAYDLLKKGLEEVKGFILDSIKESNEAARIAQQVQTNVTNAGLAYSDYAEKIKKSSAAALQLGFDDDAAALSLSKFLVVTKDFSQAQALLNLSLDLSRAKNISLEEATHAVTLVTQGNARALKDLGVNVKETASVADMLTEAQEKVKNSAKDFAGTVPGQLAHVTEEWHNIQQEVGDRLAPKLSELFTNIDENMPEIMELFQGLATIILKTADAAILATDGLTGLWHLAVANTSAALGTVSDGLTAVNDGVANFLHNGQQATQGTKDFAAALHEVANDEFTKAIDKGGAVSKVLGDLFGTTDKNTKANKELADATKKTGEATDKTTNALRGIGGASQATKDAIKKAGEQMQALRDKVLELKNKTDDLVVSLGDKLTDAVSKFKDSVNSLVTDGSKNFADIVVKADADLKDLNKKLAEEQAKSGDQQSAETIKSLKEEIVQKQKILSSYAAFQADLTKKVAEVQKKADDAKAAALTETDPTKKANLDAQVQGFTLETNALKGFADLDKQVADARKLAGEDEFKQAEINTFAKFDLATKLFIEETSKLREKQAVALQVEQSITDFYKAQIKLKQDTLDAFAASSITTLRRIGSEANAAIQALNQAQSKAAQANSISPVIPGVAPVVTPGTAPGGSSSTTNNNRTVNAPITLQATINNSIDPLQVARDLAWSLSHK